MKALDFVVQWPFSQRQRHALRSRNGITREDFVTELASGETEASAAGLLWDRLVEAAVIPNFTPSPDDDFLYIYGLADEDLDDDLIAAIFSDLGLALPSAAEIQPIGNIATPRDFMKLVRLGKAR